MLDRIYPILDRQAFEAAAKKPNELIALWFDLGIHTFQIRNKQATEADYLEFARKIKDAFPEAKIIANDFARLALQHPEVFQALHLGQEDWAGLTESERSDLVRVCHQGFKLGLSTHNLTQFKASLLLPLAYTAMGPVMPTASKPNGTDPVLGLAEQESLLQEAARASRQVVVIGGINAGNLQKVLSANRLGWFPENLRPVPAVIQAALHRNELGAMLQILGD